MLVRCDRVVWGVIVVSVLPHLVLSIDFESSFMWRNLYFQIHLDTEEFERTFKMKYSEFVTKPPWKQTELKKKHGLF